MSSTPRRIAPWAPECRRCATMFDDICEEFHCLVEMKWLQSTGIRIETKCAPVPSEAAYHPSVAMA